MKITVDARGLACPEPVLRAKKAIATNDEVIVIVDNEVAVENIRRLAVKNGCGFAVAERQDGIEVSLVRKGDVEASPEKGEVSGEQVSFAATPQKATGSVVVVLSDNRMGRGDDVLGDILIRSFVHTLTQLKPLPGAVICYNAGVKLAAKDSPVLDDLQQLAQAGVTIIVCGTCVNYFGLVDQIAAGRVSNMYEIAETMAEADRLVRP